MAGDGLSPRGDKASVKYRYRLHEGAFFELADLTTDNHAPSSSCSIKESGRKYGPKSQVMLTTAELISAIDQICNSAAPSLLDLFQHQKTTKHDTVDSDKGNKFYHPNGDEIISPSVSVEKHCWSINGTPRTSSLEEPTLGSPKVTQYISFFELYNTRCCTYYPMWRCLKGSSVTTIQSFGVNGIASVGISSDFKDVYSWMKQSKHTQIDDKKTDDCNITKDTYCPISYCHTELKKVENDSVVSVLTTSVCEENRNNLVEVDTHETENNQDMGFVGQDKSTLENFSSSINRCSYILAKQEHALAGAFAGIFVSVCLHPVDTIKTLVQSCRSDQRSIHHISRSIISERGLTGLYRGISSNIASSAPISAIYTFTYESVKGALLPIFAKEYHSLAHCVAGGCASIATSFLFTPSECIKQQMQVRAHYQNCWSTLIGIVKKGGFSSLYAGWGAVLCRNVPHSIIKFYTYESLKQWMLSSHQSNAQPNTLLTLVCGGLAGSTAALFTTPFDVVKTRLQTQIPGSLDHQYDGVVTTLQEIAKHEGLKGLYRGLTPRLVMYMTQGALFFASYESFKRLLSIEPAAQHKSRRKVEDEGPTSLSNAA